MLKAYQCTDEDLYAAENAEQAAKLCEEQSGEPCDEGYPRELDDEELDKPQPAFDEDERRIPGEYTSVREMLDQQTEPGWLACSWW